jgi:predicted phosphate transport protein (TIGR00153 family)
MSKRDKQLFGYLVQVAANVEEATKLFQTGLKDLAHPESLAARIKELEHKGDELVSELVTLLNSTYITPLEREDFLELAIKMDDIIDGLEACTVRFDLYNVTEATPVMHDFAETLVQSAREIRAAIDKLNNRKLLEIREHTLSLNQLEKSGDTLLRNSLRMLFQQEGNDVLRVIKLKEIYEILESITDRCQDVADVLDSVIVKNA